MRRRRSKRGQYTVIARAAAGHELYKDLSFGTAKDTLPKSRKKLLQKMVKANLPPAQNLLRTKLGLYRFSRSI